MTPISLIDVASHFPERVVDNGWFADGADAAVHPMFRGTRLRRHVAAHERASDMIASACERLIRRSALDPARDIDVIVTNVSLPDEPFTGCGAVVARRIGALPSHILDMANGGCISFVLMLEQVRAIFHATGARSAFVCNAQTAAGRIFAHEENRALPPSAVPGDGCGVAYVVADDRAPVLSLVTYNYPEHAEDMSVCAPDRAWWEPGERPLNIDFTDARVASIVRRGNRLVPHVLRTALREAGLAPSAVDCLVTNQPNRLFLQNWRESLALPAERHVDTFEEYGNLFGAALPIGIERARDSGALAPGRILLLGGFSHAGDYAGAAAIRWQAH